MAVTFVPGSYQCAEIITIALGRGSAAPSADHDSVNLFCEIAFMGLPWAKKMTGMGALMSVIMSHARRPPAAPRDDSLHGRRRLYDALVRASRRAMGERAAPGNGRLGAMVFGGTNTEQIALNEDTYWSGGPYSTVVKGGREVLPELQRLVFAGEYQKAHQLFGRRLMGYPVEQQKYQALGNLVLKFEGDGAISNYRNELKLDEAVARTSYSRGGVRYLREVFASAPDQVIAVRLSADRPGSLTFSAQLRGFETPRTRTMRRITSGWTGSGRTDSCCADVRRITWE